MPPTPSNHSLVSTHPTTTMGGPTPSALSVISTPTSTPYYREPVTSLDNHRLPTSVANGPASLISTSKSLYPRQDQQHEGSISDQSQQPPATITSGTNQEASQSSQTDSRDTKDRQRPPLTDGAIAGIVAGSCIVLVLACGCVGLVCTCKNRRTNGEHSSYDLDSLPHTTVRPTPMPPRPRSGSATGGPGWLQRQH